MRALVCLLLCCVPVLAESVTVGSKNFAESRLLAEIFAQLIEERTEFEVERRFNLAGTQICFEALRAGEIDLYPEYSGTGLVSILGEPAEGGTTESFNRVRRLFRERYGLLWLAPLGFENAYELAVPGELADARGLRTISDLAEVSQTLRAGLGYEFIERPDGLPGLAEAYGLAFRDVRGMQQALKYEAAAARSIDVLDVYTTDGRLLVHDLRVLADDLGFFPPYAAAPLVRDDLDPSVIATLSLLGGALDEERMRALNLRLQVEGEEVERVARDALAELGWVDAGTSEEPVARGGGLIAYFVDNRAALGRHTLRHLFLVLVALAAGVLVALPLALFLERRRRLAEPLIRAVGVTQTIPSIALLAFMIPLLGIGVKPALAALWLYSLFPILRNAYTGLRDAPPDAVAAARALGMTERQLLLEVRLPLATPVILAGLRTAAVLTVGTATLAAFIGAGGLGEPIVSGLQLADRTRILGGAIPAALLAILVDRLLAAIELRLAPAGTGGS